MTDADDSERPIDDLTELVDRNGLVKLFANRARARILVTLFYAEEPLSPGTIADGAGINDTVVHEALDPLGRFDVVEEVAFDEGPRYRLETDDELVEAVRTVAELATDRFWSGSE